MKRLPTFTKLCIIDNDMLQFITNSNNPKEIISQVEEVLSGGCKWIQLRMKDASKDDIVPVAEKMKEICKQNDCIFVIDDWVEIAKELKLDGVHLGKNDMNPVEARMLLGSEAIIGVTANTFEDIRGYSNLDIDYIGLGPYKYTTTKRNLSPVLGLSGYSSIMQMCAKNGIRIPTVAIGGICYDDIEGIMQTGVNGIAVSGSIINANNPAEMTKSMLHKLNHIISKRLNK